MCLQLHENMPLTCRYIFRTKSNHDYKSQMDLWWRGIYWRSRGIYSIRRDQNQCWQDRQKKSNHEPTPVKSLFSSAEGMCEKTRTCFYCVSCFSGYFDIFRWIFVLYIAKTVILASPNSREVNPRDVSGVNFYRTTDQTRQIAKTVTITNYIYVLPVTFEPGLGE